MHSQKLRDKPLEPWIIAEKDGEILAAHCTCMAGLGETCTHVASLLFAVSATVTIRDSKTVTEEKAYWLIPSPVKNIEYKEIKEIDFTSANSKRKKFDAAIHSICHPTPSSSTTSSAILQSSVSSSSLPFSSTCSSLPCTTPLSEEKKKAKLKLKVPEPSEQEAFDFLQSLHDSGVNSAIFALTPPFCEQFVPKSLQSNFLTEFYEESLASADLDDIRQFCSTLDISFSQEEADNAEMATKEQSQSDTWFRLRAGRITASKMKSVCRTDPNHPSISLIKSICYPERFKFSSPATAWGCNHEEEASLIFISKMKENHTNFKMENCGLFLNPQFPHLGASPDGKGTFKHAK